MIFDNTLKGKYVSLRSVTYEDAEFIVKIRNDETKNSYVNAVSTDIMKQQEWIEKQINREYDYYFVIEDEDSNPIGLSSVYDIGLHKGAAEFGRWISWGSAIQNVESVILAFDFAFEHFDVDYIYMRMMKENSKVIRFWKQFGAKFEGEEKNDDMILSKWIVTKVAYYDKLRDKTLKILKY